VNLERSNTSGSDDGDAGDRDGDVPETGFDAWSREIGRYHDEIAWQGRGVLGQLKDCHSPLDVLAVERAWLGAWSRAHFEAGFRFAQAFARIAQALPSDGQTERTPRRRT